MATLFRKRSVVKLLERSKYSREITNQQASKPQKPSACFKSATSFYSNRWRAFHTSCHLNKVIAFKLSDIGEGIREVVIKEWFVKEGDRVAQFDNICEVQSDKAAVTITSRYDGVITKLYGAVEDKLLVGNPLVDVDVGNDAEVEEEAAKDTREESSAANKETPLSPTKTKVLTTPAVRRIASQYNVELHTVKATGKNGRVLKEDVLNHLNITSDQSNEIPESATVQAQTFQLGTYASVAQDQTVPVSGFTRVMVRTMTESLKIPHFVLSDEYDVTELVKLRATLKEMSAARGVKLTYMPFIVKAASLALAQYPVINSSLDATCENIIYKASHNIGVAMDTPNGLVVPVIKNVQGKSILEIAAEINKLQELGAQGKLGMAEISGGTFTISNIGTVGGTYTKPIILAPQVSIGAFGKIQVLPRFDERGGVRPAHVVNVSWSADHRVIDGVTMAKFSNQMRSYLERPSNFIVDL